MIGKSPDFDDQDWGLFNEYYSKVLIDMILHFILQSFYKYIWNGF